MVMRLDESIDDFFEKFWKYVFKQINSECWVWQGLCNYKGQGIIYFRSKKLSVPKIMYSLTYKVSTNKKTVVSFCGRANCCNPKHLQML